MWKYIAPAVRITVLFTVLTGLVYPLAVTGICRVLFPFQAGGSLVTSSGKVAGSRWIGQNFTRAEYFHPRPSAAGAGYDGLASGGSNLAPTNSALLTRVAASVVSFRKENPGFKGTIPADAVTASASGLDPDVSPANADAQAARVAAARHASLDQIRAAIARETSGRTLGFLGEPRVNVLELNLRLDRELPVQSR